MKAFEQRRANHAAGDTDLAWTRLTHWRALLAAALDFPPHDAVTAASVTGETISPSTDLMAGWLAGRLGREGAPVPGATEPGWSRCGSSAAPARSSCSARTGGRARCASPGSRTG